MKLEPRNKHLLLELVKNETKEEKVNEFFVASNTKKPDNLAYRVVDKADDCNISVHIGQVILVEGNMVLETRVGEQTFLTCKENFVIGVIRE